MTHPSTTYDELPYDTRPVHGTSPLRLALCSLLHGGPRPPLEGFRALEIGCGSAQNLLPLAFYHPDASFVGVDNAETALAAGRAAAAEIGIENMRLEWMDLTAPSALTGTFDYVIVHGVFSWVDASVRRRILELCATHVTPGGLIYISHNVDAGWRVRGLVRDTVLAAAEGAPTAAERNRRARERAEALHAITEHATEHPYHALLNEELLRVMASTESYLAHETLSPENVAFRHGEVVTMLAEHGFDYLADALYERPEGRAPEPIGDAVAQLTADPVEREHLADVLCYRRFRSSVFCRSEARVADSRERAMAQVDGLFATSTIDPESADEEQPADVDDISLPADAQLAAALLLLASVWPGSVRVSELIARTRDLIESDPMPDALLRSRILDLHMRGRIALQIVAPPAGASGSVPHRLARYQAAHGYELTTATHEGLEPEPVHRATIELLAEGLDANAVARELARRVSTGVLTLPGDVLGDDPEAAPDAAVHQCLDTLANWGLLE